MTPRHFHNYKATQLRRKSLADKTPFLVLALLLAGLILASYGDRIQP